jgi:hypothetical protein
MFEVVRSIEYKGHVIQERRITSASGGVAPSFGGHQIIPPVSVASTQWGVVKKKSDGQEEEVALAWSEEDAKRQIDELVR